MRRLLFILGLLISVCSFGQRDTLVVVGSGGHSLGGDSKKEAYTKINTGFDYSDARIDSVKTTSDNLDARIDSSKAVFDYTDLTVSDDDVLYWDDDSSRWVPRSAFDIGSAGYGEMGNTADATEVLATANQWFAMFHANINADAPHLNDQFTFTAGSEGVIASSSTDAGATVTFTDVAHGLLAGDYITINGTTSYNDAYVVLSKTDDTFTITETNSTGDESGLWQMGSYLTVSHTGVYRGVWNTSFKQSDNAARTSIIAPFVNTTASTKAAANRYLSNTTDIGSIGGNGLMSFTVGDRIWFACQSTDPQTLTFTIRNITIH